MRHVGRVPFAFDCLCLRLASHSTKNKKDEPHPKKKNIKQPDNNPTSIALSFSPLHDQVSQQKEAIAGLIRRVMQTAEDVHLLQLNAEERSVFNKQIRSTLQSVADDRRYSRLVLCQLMLEGQVTNIRLQVWIQKMVQLERKVQEILQRNNQGNSSLKTPEYKKPEIEEHSLIPDIKLPEYGKHMKTNGSYLNSPKQLIERIMEKDTHLTPKLTHNPERAIAELKEILSQHKVACKALLARQLRVPLQEQEQGDTTTQGKEGAISTSQEDGNNSSIIHNCSSSSHKLFMCAPATSLALNSLYRRVKETDAVLAAHDAAMLRRTQKMLQKDAGENGVKSKKQLQKKSKKRLSVLNYRQKALSQRAALHNLLEVVLSAQSAAVSNHCTNNNDISIASSGLSSSLSASSSHDIFSQGALMNGIMNNEQYLADLALGKHALKAATVLGTSKAVDRETITLDKDVLTDILGRLEQLETRDSVEKDAFVVPLSSSAVPVAASVGISNKEDTTAITVASNVINEAVNPTEHENEVKKQETEPKKSELIVMKKEKSTTRLLLKDTPMSLSASEIIAFFRLRYRSDAILSRKSHGMERCTQLHPLSPPIAVVPVSSPNPSLGNLTCTYMCRFAKESDADFYYKHYNGVTAFASQARHSQQEQQPVAGKVGGEGKALTVSGILASGAGYERTAFGFKDVPPYKITFEKF